jgi:hypothetical protein
MLSHTLTPVHIEGRRLNSGYPTLSHVASLALSIGLIASLKRAEETTVPSLPVELIITPTLVPLADFSGVTRYTHAADINIVAFGSQIYAACLPMAMLPEPVVLP